MLLVGVDPGLTGGVAILGMTGTAGRDFDEIAVGAMPTRDHFSGKGREVAPDLVRDFVLGFRKADEPVGLFVVEHVSNVRPPKKSEPAAPAPGKEKSLGGAMGVFAFGDGFGLVRGVPILMGWPRDYPRPGQWQKVVFAGKSAKGDAKRMALSFVSRRYPQVCLLATAKSKVPHKGIVDALCILEYARRIYGGNGGS